MGKRSFKMIDTEKAVYLLAQEHCGLKPGDYVKVTRTAYDNEAGWGAIWNYGMNCTVGHIGKIRDFGGCGGIAVIFDAPINDCWRYPYFVLEKVEKLAPKFKPFDKVLVRDSDEGNWRCAIFNHFDKGSPFPYTTTSVSWKQCIPYEGNEHLVGTSDNP